MERIVAAVNIAMERYEREIKKNPENTQAVVLGLDEINSILGYNNDEVYTASSYFMELLDTPSARLNLVSS